MEFRHRSNSISHTRGNLFDETVEGYCMVLRRKTKHYELKIDKQSQPCKLQIDNPSVIDQHLDKNDILRGLQHNVYRDGQKRKKEKKYPIEYKIIESHQHSEFIYIVVSCQEHIVEKFAKERNFDVPIDPIQALIISKTFCTEFSLAKRTYLPTPKNHPKANDTYTIKMGNQNQEFPLYRYGKDDNLYKRDRNDYDFIVADNKKYKFGLNETDYDEKHGSTNTLNLPPKIANKYPQGLPEGQAVINGELTKLIPYWYWEDLHIAYDPMLHREYKGINIYKRPLNTRSEKPVTSAISHVLYLRILHEILTDDTELDGADLKIGKAMADEKNPLCQFFALKQKEIDFMVEKKFKQFQCIVFACGCSPKLKGRNTKFLDSIRNYYGEQIAFYFAFLVHYTVWLYPLAFLGTIWWIIEYLLLDIGSVGSIVVILVIIMWTTLLIENWYRREWKLRVRWGMMRYRNTQIPRATFRGKYVLSTVSGMRIETHNNKCLYWFKRIISIFISFICVLMVILATVFIWGFQKGYNKGDSIDKHISIMIGIANSAQILIFNKIFTSIAYCLNDWEGHRLEEQYYNQLVLKRISFIVINSFYSLFYIAFVDDRKAYDDNKVRLKALRMQLVTLFLMALLYQNAMEIFFPVFCPKLMHSYKNCCSSHRHKRKRKTELQKELETQRLIDMDSDDDEFEIQSSDKLHQDNIKDIIEQCELSESPDVLDNVSEIVVLHGYVTLFIIVFPLMPLLAVINALVELFVDKYNLRKTQRPVPVASAGLGVWTTVMSVFGVIAIYTNFAILTFRTDVVVDFLKYMEEFFADVEQIYWTNEDIVENQITFFFIGTTTFVFIVVGIRMCIPDISDSTADGIARQIECERELLRGSIALKERKKNEYIVDYKDL